MHVQSKFNEKQLVKQSYEEIYQQYIVNIPGKEKLYDIPPVEFFIESVKKLQNSKVIELGCGNGIPLGVKLIQNKIQYYAVEYSKNMHELALKNMKSRAEYIYNGQMLKHCQSLPQQSLSGVVSLFALQHLTPHEQVQLFSHIHRILIPNGIFLFNTLQDDIGIEESFEGVQKTFGIVKDFLGKPNYSAFLPSEWYIKTLQILGFQLINKFTGQNNCNNIIQHPIYMVFRRKKILSTEESST